VVISTSEESTLNMQHPHFRRTLVSLALLGTGFTAQATDETMTVVGKRCKAWKEKRNRNR
ncbi:MAG: hypothetical protein ACRC7D_14190, partial [Aeromonas popoffii]|uniref:hypothetical protein n=1 Tax=Aeromonas popoffii TaxID=70856 RepID=UPI003F3C5604